MELRVGLLGGFRLQTGDEQVAVSGGSERLLAFIALRCHAVPRGLLAGSLWPDAEEHRAYSCLRSALTRLDGVGRRLIDVSATEIRLNPGTEVDVHDARSLAQRILDPALPVEDGDLSARTVSALSDDLLPGWYDDWAVGEADEWRQLRLHALEALAAEFIAAGRPASAVCAAGIAVRADPLRESAHAALIAAHLAEGNQIEALRDFDQYAGLLYEETTLRPTDALTDLIAGLREPH
jgi:SARP family transcriptional regulator, regulator of embCAB operon